MSAYTSKAEQFSSLYFALLAVKLDMGLMSKPSLKAAVNIHYKDQLDGIFAILRENLVQFVLNLQKVIHIFLVSFPIFHIGLKFQMFILMNFRNFRNFRNQSRKTVFFYLLMPF